MQGFTLGAGLAAMAFWFFIAAVVVGGIWYDIRKKESQQETIRRLFESGQPVDDQLMDRLMSSTKDSSERLDRAFKLTALILLPTAVGLAVLGIVLGMEFDQSKLPLLGVAGLVACIGLGFAVAARVARGWYEDDNKSKYEEI
jgi:hypothetical protein